MKHHPARRTVASLAFALALLLLGGGALASPAPAEAKRERATRAGESAESGASAVQQYCANIANTAAAAELAIREQQLRELEQQMRQRLEQLDQRRVEVQQAIERYEAVVRKAGETVANVYSRMNPDAAAAQIAGLDDEVAAALLLRLKPQNSSAILNEMEPPRAAAVAKKLADLTSAKPEGSSR
jgi:flagellar motility protein MotE (MotC chaperone)